MAVTVTFSTSLEGLDPTMLDGGFFEGWAAAPTPAQHLQLLLGSSHVVIARDGDQVIGFVNAISDGLLCAYIPLLEVLPSYRGCGTGKELLRRLFVELDHLYMVDVMCDEDVLPFYEAVGMQAANGAVRRNYAWRDPLRGVS